MDQNKQQEYYDELITGYLNRSLTPEQEKELSRWVAANESHKKHYYEMTELWLSSYDKQHKNGRKNEAVYRRFAEQAGFRKQKLQNFDDYPLKKEKGLLRDGCSSPSFLLFSLRL